MITPRMIEKKTMTAAKKKEAKNSLFAFYIGRPISYVLTIPLLYTSISPNAVTLISIAFSVIGFGLLCFGQTTALRLIGVLCFFLWNLGDGIDGNIARYKNIKSPNGDLLDTLGGYLAMVLIILGMGGAAFNDSLGSTYLPVIVPMAFGGVSAVFTLIPRTLMHRQLAMKKSDTKSDVSLLKDKAQYGVAKIIVLNICDPAGFQELIMLIAILVHRCTEFTLFYFLINTAMMFYSIVSLMKDNKMSGLERQ